MYEKPDLDTVLADMRENSAAWEKNADETRAGVDTLTWGQQIDRMGERDDFAMSLVEGFKRLDEVMSTHRGLGSVAPASWSVDRLTDEDLAKAKEQWPELAIFEDKVIRNYADLLGIRAVRYLAQVAVRNAPAVLKVRESK
ncbi:hypothetical protein [Streptomyces sp. NPDC016172]|uniref:hypothetical protein n=1 Tax=Streptomyces sp. NPDC016172 TaxID=3364964 RepID=UPI0036FF69A6